MAVPIPYPSDSWQAYTAPVDTPARLSPEHSAADSEPRAADRPARREDPTGLHQHHAHCAAARHQLHALQSAVEAVDAFLSPRFFSMLAVTGGGALLAFWLTA